MRALRPIILGLLFLAAAPAAPAQSWSAETPMLQARAAPAAAVLDGKIYVMGGVGQAGQVLGSAEVFDPQTGTWRYIEELRDAVAGAAAVAYNGRILLMGGREAGGDVSDDVAAYDPSEDDWDSFQHLQVERQGLGAVVLDGMVYAAGGTSESGSFLNVCEYYDARDDDWRLSDTWLLDRARASFGIAEVGGAAYFAGGFSALGPLNLFQRYAPGYEGIETLPPMAMARGGLAFAADDQGHLYAIGGRSPANQVLASVERFDIAANRWEPFASLETAREDAVAVFAGGTLYVIGGRDAFGAALSSVEVLRLSTAGEGAAEPSAFRLEAPHPNPFAGWTTLAFELAEPGPVRLAVYDVRGREVAVLAEGPLPAGAHTVAWDGTAGGRTLPGGVYLARLEAEAGQATVKLTLLR